MPAWAAVAEHECVWRYRWADCGAIGGRPMRTFHELVVVVLQSRALLSHVCFSTCTQGCMGLRRRGGSCVCQAGGTALNLRTHAGLHRAVCSCGLPPSHQRPTAASSLPRTPAER